VSVLADRIPNMPRLMRDEAFRSEQWERRFEPHIAPINRLVDKLQDPGGRGWLPYVAPLHGGVRSTVLSVLRDPGPATQQGSGSGFLSIENDDPTAARQAELFAVVDVSPAAVLPWNAYPWYVNRAPSAGERQIGVDPLMRLLNLAPDVRVVLLQGNDAKDTWRRLLRAYPTVEEDRDLTVVGTIHPGRQALFHADPGIRAARIQNQVDAFAAVAGVVADIAGKAIDKSVSRMH
jgi:hypothetical protein